MSTACPSGKVKYRDELAARMARALMPDKGKRKEKSAYRCPLCNSWHLTSRPVRRKKGSR